MKTRNLFTFSLALLLAVSVSATTLAQPIIDGNASGTDGYGAALSIQNTQTQYGDNSDDDLVATATGGSEINQVFGTVANGRLYVTISGNLETNFNKLHVYVDSVAGGVNEIDGDQLPAAVDAFCCGGIGTTDGALQRQDGLVFDDDFAADYYLTFSNGKESVNTGEFNREFWGVSAHYADLTDGTNGAVVAAGIQFAPRGLPQVLRGPLGGDFNENGSTAGEDFLTWQRGFGIGTTKAEGDADGNNTVDATDLGIWGTDYGQQPTLSDFPFNPNPGGLSTEDVLLGPTLPGLSQGQLIDKNYALAPGPGGCSVADDDGGTGCIAAELEFVLPVDSNDPTNALSHRNFENTIDLELGFDNSNIAGVEGGGGAIVTGDPENVTTGLEFSIPLSQIGSPTGDIKITAYIGNGAHNEASNQFSGVGIEAGNPGDVFFLELDMIAGDQFVTISQTPPAASAVPEPSSLVLVMLAAANVLLGRRSR